MIRPESLCDDPRVGFGAQRIERLYTGSIEMLEPTPAALDEVVVNLLPGIEEQKKYSEALRKGEVQARSTSARAAGEMSAALDAFRSSISTLLEPATCLPDWTNAAPSFAYVVPGHGYAAMTGQRLRAPQIPAAFLIRPGLGATCLIRAISILENGLG